MDTLVQTAAAALLSQTGAVTYMFRELIYRGCVLLHLLWD
jgi:hypothetical protein